MVLKHALRAHLARVHEYALGPQERLRLGLGALPLLVARGYRKLRLYGPSAVDGIERNRVLHDGLVHESVRPLGVDAALDLRGQPGVAGALHQHVCRSLKEVLGLEVQRRALRVFQKQPDAVAAKHRIEAAVGPFPNKGNLRLCRQLESHPLREGARFGVREREHDGRAAARIGGAGGAAALPGNLHLGNHVLPVERDGTHHLKTGFACRLYLARQIVALLRLRTRRDGSAGNSSAQHISRICISPDNFLDARANFTRSIARPQFSAEILVHKHAIGAAGLLLLAFGFRILVAPPAVMQIRHPAYRHKRRSAKYHIEPTFGRVEALDDGGNNARRARLARRVGGDTKFVLVHLRIEDVLFFVGGSQTDIALHPFICPCGLRSARTEIDAATRIRTRGPHGSMHLGRGNPVGVAAPIADCPHRAGIGCIFLRGNEINVSSMNSTHAHSGIIAVHGCPFPKVEMLARLRRHGQR